MTNKLSLLPEKYKSQLNMPAIVRNSLYYHFVDQETIFQDILFNMPSHHLVAEDKQTFHRKHWETSNLFSKEKGDIFGLGEVLSSVISQHLAYVGSNKVSMTLTGGFDSRVVLASLLNKDVLPSVCTYGNPLSSDVKIAKIIAQDYGLDFYNPNDPTPTKQWFSQAVEQTLLTSNSLASVFRAFRFSFMSSFVQETKPDVLFTGYFGGEGIRGYYGNDYYESGLFFDLSSENKHIAEKYQPKTFFNLDNYSNEDLQIESLNPHFKQNERILAYLYEVIARVHHGSDIDLYKSLNIHVANPFLDIDYLSYLHKSGISFLNKRSTLFNKLSYMKTYISLIESFHPSLLSYDLSNGFSLEEYQKCIILSFIKRALKSKTKQKANFMYGKWFRDYITDIDVDSLPIEVLQAINLSRYRSSLANTEQGPEPYWLKYTSVTTIVELLNLFTNELTIK